MPAVKGTDAKLNGVLAAAVVAGVEVVLAAVLEVVVVGTEGPASEFRLDMM